MSKILRHLGFLLLRQKGSHAYFRHPDGRSTVAPMHRGEDLGRGLIRAILLRRFAPLFLCHSQIFCRKNAD
ncbi:MAG: type II toxin-antitoxin system HicA family toxin [Elusimicrobia bacterium]|nr:type II toxin-antitoxin system HicA family toxin [Candidatus Obscuribacterium magneticum]